MKVVTAAQMQAIDRAAIEERGIAGGDLMEAAGAAVARTVLNWKVAGPVLVACGTGNNGGDGFVAARHLRLAGRQVQCILLGGRDRMSGDARRAADGAVAAGVPIREMTGTALPEEAEELCHGAGVIVDALYGTGLTRALSGAAAALVERINRVPAWVAAVDVPSGLDATTGQPLGPVVRAGLTVTMGLPKWGLLRYPGAEYAGDVVVASIGFPADLLEGAALDREVILAGKAAGWIPPRPGDSHKGRTGHLLIVGGSSGFSGAPVLAALGALYSGAGLVTVGVPSSIYRPVAARLLEPMPHPLPEHPTGALGLSALAPIRALGLKAGALAIGPGLGREADTLALVREALSGWSAPVVVDADGLAALAPCAAAPWAGPAVLTPHPGELAALLGRSVDDIAADPVGSARAAAARFGAVVVLKGARSLVVAPDGRVAVNPTGNPGMASGGMGDVLTGLVGSLLVQGAAPWDAARLGVYLHGLAGDAAAAAGYYRGLTAGAVAAALPKALELVETGTVGMDGPLPDQQECWIPSWNSRVAGLKSIITR